MLVAHALAALEATRPSATPTRVLDMKQLLSLGVLRDFQGIGTLREQVQGLLHLNRIPEMRAPLARSTWSDALASSRRLQSLGAMIPGLVRHAETLNRLVFAGSYGP